MLELWAGASFPIYVVSAGGSSLGLCVCYVCTLCYSPASLIFTKPFQNFSYLGLLLAQQEKYNVVKVKVIGISHLQEEKDGTDNFCVGLNLIQGYIEDC